MNIAEFSRVEARCPFGRNGLYGREWEVCGGSRGIDPENAAEWIADQKLFDKHDPEPIEYRYVPGRALTDAEFEAWLAAETRLGRQLTDIEFLATLPA